MVQESVRWLLATRRRKSLILRRTNWSGNGVSVPELCKKELALGDEAASILNNSGVVT